MNDSPKKYKEISKDRIVPRQLNVKIVLVSSMLPSGHYSQVLASGFEGNDDCELIV
jgi:hypothetical protein